MASGYIEYSNSTGTSLSTSWSSAITLTTSTELSDTNSRQILPSSGVSWSHIEITFTTGGGLPDDFSLFLSWDDAGKEVVAGPASSITPHSVVSNTYTVVVDLGIVPTFPDSTLSGVTSGTKGRGNIYLFAKLGTTGTSPTLKLARLHWHALSKG